MSLRVPTKNNAKLESLLAAIEADAELNQLWRCANVNAVDRLGISDHGEVHIRIIANAALRVFRLLVDGGVTPSAVQHHELEVADAEVIVVLAAALHDVGIAIHRDDHERYSLIIAYTKARQLLAGMYSEPQLTTMVSEVLHAIIAHNSDQRCLTIEAGCVKLADALDMTEGRSRIPFDAGKVNIHSISALAVKEVKILKGESKPVRIEVDLHNSAGIFQMDNLLRKKLLNSTLIPYVEVRAAVVEGETEKRLMTDYTL
jgi:metal-dependent HD superfamily phosphatase/phosphodiesterase